MEPANLHPEGQNVEKILLVENQMGIHARPAAMIVRTANKFEADLFFEMDNEQVNGKSIMGLMMLAASKGSVISVHATGEDAEAAVEALAMLVRNRFDED